MRQELAVLFSVLMVTAASWVANQPLGAQPSPPLTRRPSVSPLKPGPCPTNVILDDAEDGDGRIVAADGRGGPWYAYADALGTSIDPRGPFHMAHGGARGSKWAARLRGETAASGNVYAGLGFSIHDPKAPSDLSCCRGVSFWAKERGKPSAIIRFNLGDAQTMPEGKQCRQCYNHFGAYLKLTETWTRYEFSFGALKQQWHWGELFEHLVPSAIYTLDWMYVRPNDEFDIWIDDIELSGCGCGAAP